MRPSTVRAWWDYRFSTGIQDGVVEVVGIISAVSDEEAAWNALDQASGKKHLAAMTGAGDEASGVAETVGRDVELGA